MTKVSLLLFALALVAGGSWFHRLQKEGMRHSAEEKLTAIAQLKVKQIVGWRNERLAAAAVLSDNPYLIRGVERFLNGKNVENTDAILSFLSSLQANYHYADILLVNPEGKLIFSLTGTEYQSSKYMPALGTALRQGSPTFIDLHIAREDSTPQVSVVAPLFLKAAGAERTLGALILVSNASQFLCPMIQAWPTPTKTAETLLVRRDGNDVLFLNELRHQKGTALKLRIPLSRNELPASMAVSGRTGIVRGRDYRGVEVVAAIFPIPASPWFMVAKVDATEVFANWRFRSTLITALVLGFAIMIGTIGLILRQREKKLHYRALYQSESMWRAIMERQSVTLKSIGDAVIATDAQGAVELLNPVAEALTGWTNDDARGRPLQEVFRIVSEQTREKAEDPVARVLREGGIVGLANHTLLIDRDGTERPIADSGAPIRNDKGETTGVVLVFRDQTKERAAAANLAERERYYRSMIFNLHEDILVIDHDYCITDMNNTAMMTLGLDRDAVVGKKCYEVSHSLNSPCHENGEHCVLAEVFATGESSNCRHKHIHSDGTQTHIDILMSPLKNEDGRVTHVIEAARDITDLVQAQNALERLLSAIEQTGEMIVITDAAGSIQYVNPAFERVTGYTRKEAIGNNPRMLKSGTQDDLFYRSLWETISSGGTFKSRFVNKRKDGTLFTEEASIAPVRDASGRIVNYVAVKRDITDRLQLTDQLQQAQKMESVGRLAGGVAHDYNNMLSVIIGFAELALDKVDPSNAVRGDLNEILNAAKRSAEITRQLLAFARKQTIAPKVLDLNEIMDSMLKMLRRLIGEDIDLYWHPENQLWPILIDPSQLEQILANLCVNARDAISGAGKVTIETNMVTFDEAYCTDHPGFVTGEFVLLAVSDDGCGMDKEILDHIFEPFFTTKSENEGTGLGLATVYGIVKQNNGFINIYSESGKGTTFKIYLPRHVGEAEKIGSDDIPELRRGRGELVLVVEDEPTIMKLCEMMLIRLGYDVLTAGTPDEAVKLAEAHTGEIHLLLTDVVMPGIDGRELANRLSALHPDIKVLFMSGYTTNVIAHRGVLEEGVQFIHKPFSLKDMGMKIREILDDNNE